MWSCSTCSLELSSLAELHICDDVNLSSCIKNTTEPKVLWDCTGHIHLKCCARHVYVCMCIYVYTYTHTHIYIQLYKYTNHPMMGTVQQSQKDICSCFIINACVHVCICKYTQLAFHHTVHSVFVCFI